MEMTLLEQVWSVKETPRVREFLVNKQRTRLTESSQAFFHSVTLQFLDSVAVG